MNDWSYYLFEHITREWLESITLAHCDVCAIMSLNSGAFVFPFKLLFKYQTDFFYINGVYRKHRSFCYFPCRPISSFPILYLFRDSICMQFLMFGAYSIWCGQTSFCRIIFCSVCLAVRRNTHFTGYKYQFVFVQCFTISIYAGILGPLVMDAYKRQTKKDCECLIYVCMCV